MQGFPDAMPVHGRVGGLPMGLAAAFMLLPNGRVAGHAVAGLIGGAAWFGIGWGLAAPCPGPAIAAWAIAPGQAPAFDLFTMIGFGLLLLLPAAN